MDQNENQIVVERIWVTAERAADIMGLPASWFHQRTTPSAGVWPEGEVWKWYEGRKLFKIDALTAEIDRMPSDPSRRGRRTQHEQRTSN